MGLSLADREQLRQRVAAAHAAVKAASELLQEIFPVGTPVCRLSTGVKGAVYYVGRCCDIGVLVESGNVWEYPAADLDVVDISELPSKLAEWSSELQKRL